MGRFCPADGQERFIDRSHVIGYAFATIPTTEQSDTTWAASDRFVGRILMAVPGSDERPYTIVVEDDEAHELRAILAQHASPYDV